MYVAIVSSNAEKIGVRGILATCCQVLERVATFGPHFREQFGRIRTEKC